MSRLFVRTLRDDPADAEVPSHRWLVRAGYIRRVAPGIYSWLPLGLKVLQKVETVVREEMVAMGAQEVHFPALLPREPFEATNRWSDYGANLFRLQDRRGNDMLLGPTHEEIFTLTVKDMYNSYKDLPLSLFQIQTKYRDEARPRAGVLRGREFVMKDSYSFDIDDEGLNASYQAHRDAYVRIFDRLGLEYVIVSAMAGAMGGSASEEFLAVAANGEDTFVRSPGGYAANVEAVRIAVPDALPIEDAPAIAVVDTPLASSIAAVVDLLNAEHAQDHPWTADQMLKNLVFLVTHPDGTSEPLAIGVPGDRGVDAKRLEAAFEPSVALPFTAEDFEKYPSLKVGFMGPVTATGEAVLGEESTSGIRYVVDPRVVTGTHWVSGANTVGQHLSGVTVGRDFTPDGVLDVADVREGDPAPDGSGPMQLARGIEMGHIFQLGRRYAEALGLKVLDRNGKLVTVTMGSYGVGVSRAVAAVAEATCDDKGLSWPLALAPYQVQILATGKDASVFEEADRIAAALSERGGLDVLVDDRKASPGVKFADGEILGMPIIVVVGRGLVDGVVEVRNRATGERREVAVADAVSAVLELAGR
ncbi:proline--tRNA ligase [Tessaracoccus antarcticus]|uniref:Proline--tRNA ligase n=1 Tax=Tessaracoccus antarcticus TaxID=2479848 RepID=A0A3M0GCC1_9ACTN|nr:proline--tRNA ligase [Tessaracoccus antarcticus]RMB60282.1 proline--tRNA ligase [Tessaracoccus antarcticus]